MRYRFAFLIAFLLLFFSVSVLAAQDEQTCPNLVEQALTAIGENCAALDRNSGCYGYNRLDTEFVSEMPEDFFSTPADRAPLIDVVRIQTAPMDLANETWGVAVMNVQANVPNSLPGQAVTFILLGDTEIENAVPADQAVIPGDPVPSIVTATARVNLRSGPGTSFNVVGTASPQEILQIDGKNEAGDWVRVVQENGTAWISRSLIDVSNDNTEAFDALPAVTGSESLTPMQAFYFSTGIGVPGCVEAPDLLVIQGPKEAKVNLTVNGAEISIGSTVALFSDDTTFGDLMAFGVLPDQLGQLNTDDDTQCRHTRMVVIDGEALLNGDDTELPVGHFGEQASCFDEDGEPILLSDWDNIRRLSQGDLAIFKILENIPEEVLRYPIVLPSDADIDDALTAPTPTPRPVTQPRPTQQQSGGNNNNNTTPPTATPTPEVSADPCAGFAITSPFGSVNYGPQDFYWNPVTTASTNVGAYQVDITGYIDGKEVGRKLIRVGANVTSINFNVMELPRPSEVKWFVQALVGAEPNWTTVCQTMTVANTVSHGG